MEEVIGHGADLSRCFLVLDDVIHDERAAEEDVVLYCAPSTWPLRLHVHLIQLALPMLDFARNFTAAPVRVLELQRCKLAYCAVGGPYVMVLTGSVHDSNRALEQHCQLVAHCFAFCHGSVAHVAAQCTDRRKLQRALARACAVVLPLVHGFHSAPFKFSPLPLTHLDFPFRDSVGSHVLAAHRLLAAVAAAVPSRLVGSVVVYRSSIVLTELPPLLARFSALVASHQYSQVAYRLADGEHTCDYLRVYPPHLPYTDADTAVSATTPISHIASSETLTELETNASSERPPSTALHVFMHSHEVVVASLVHPEHATGDTADLLADALTGVAGDVSHLGQLLARIAPAEGPADFVPDPAPPMPSAELHVAHNFFKLGGEGMQQRGVQTLDDASSVDAFTSTVNWAHDLFSYGDQGVSALQVVAASSENDTRTRATRYFGCECYVQTKAREGGATADALLRYHLKD